MNLLSKKVNILSKFIDMNAQKSKVIANNIANVNTPGYKKLEVNFQEELTKAVKSGNVDKINDVTAKVTFSDNPFIRENGSNVDIDMELIEFYKTTDSYTMSVEMLSKMMKGTIAAIQGR